MNQLHLLKPVAVVEKNNNVSLPLCVRQQNIKKLKAIAPITP